jgi:hypothetical protein
MHLSFGIEMKQILATALFVSLAGIATSASAVTLDQVNQHDVFDGGGSQSVKVSSSYGSSPVTGEAGGFHLTDGVTDFLAWCLDIGHNLVLPFDYSITSDPFSNSVDLTANQIGRINRLFDLEYQTVMANQSNSATQDKYAGGFQLALWEIVYESSSASSYNVASGRFQADSTRSYGSDHPFDAAVSLANQFLGDVLNTALIATNEFDLIFYQSDRYGGSWGDPKYSQNLVTVTPVPLPAAGLLLGGSLLGLFALKRRKRPEAQTA